MCIIPYNTISMRYKNSNETLSRNKRAFTLKSGAILSSRTFPKEFRNGFVAIPVDIARWLAPELSCGNGPPVHHKAGGSSYSLAVPWVSPLLKRDVIALLVCPFFFNSSIHFLLCYCLEEFEKEVRNLSHYSLIIRREIFRASPRVLGHTLKVFSG